jgi:hypothetical protein
VWPAVAAAIVGGGIFLSQGGWAPLDPWRLDWIRPGSDWAYHTVAWLYFRDAPWQVPLGRIPDLLHPVGSTVVLTDALPWISIPLKLVSRSPLQIVGPWLALCYVLAGWWGARLAQALGARPMAAAIAGVFFALSPVMMHRVEHDALTAHFLLLAALTVAVSARPRQTLWGAVLLPLIAIGVHPYLLAMVYPLALAALLRGAWIDELFPGRVALGAALAMTAALYGLAALLGIPQQSFAVQGSGFGHYGTDLATLFTTQNSSWILPDLPGQQARWEGYGYLGLGGLVLVVSALGLEIARRGADRRWRRSLPVAVVVLGAALFALADPIRWLGQPLVETTALWRPFEFLTGAFRTSGRFIWPLYYALLAAAIGVWCLRAPRAAPWVLGAFLLLQSIDTKSGFLGLQYRERFDYPARDPRWELARGEYRHLVLFPPRCGDGSGTCCPGFSSKPFKGDTTQMMAMAALGLSTNSTGVGRLDRAAHAIACKDLQADVDAGRLDPRSIYQIGGGFEARFSTNNPGAVCGILDGTLTCVAPDAPAAFRIALQAR